jgi:hypothetical protein
MDSRTVVVTLVVLLAIAASGVASLTLFSTALDDGEQPTRDAYSVAISDPGPGTDHIRKWASFAPDTTVWAVLATPNGTVADRNWTQTNTTGAARIVLDVPPGDQWPLRVCAGEDRLVVERCVDRLAARDTQGDRDG